MVVGAECRKQWQLCDCVVRRGAAISQANLFSSELIEKLRDARVVTVLTGAGISAESGVPTFRGEEGLWQKFKPEELATVDGFLRNPELVWEWYRHRREILSTVGPNPGHLALRDLEEYFEIFTLITQNIDGLHQRAGNRQVIELHGNIRRNRCLKCGRRFDDLSLDENATVPTCQCGGALRPDVVWFGESLPPDALETAYVASSRCDVFFSIGTSAVVYPAASLPIVALQGGAYVVEVNVEPTAITQQVHLSVRGKSGQVLPQLVKVLQETRKKQGLG